VLAAPVHIDSAPARLRNEPAVQTMQDRFLNASGDLQALADIEREAIAFAIDYHGGRMSRVARALGIGRSTLYRKLHEYGMAEGLINDAA
jgi:DNA-binding NtrC family response regulator